MFLQLDNMHKTLGSQAQFVRDIWKNPTMPPEEKRQFIDDAYRGMLAVATTGTNLLRDVQAMPAPEPPVQASPAPPDGAQWAAQKRQQLKAGGFSDQEIADYLARAPKALAATP